jgi:hypothetical protein
VNRNVDSDGRDRNGRCHELLGSGTDQHQVVCKLACLFADVKCVGINSFVTAPGSRGIAIEAEVGDWACASNAAPYQGCYLWKNGRIHHV